MVKRESNLNIGVYRQEFEFGVGRDAGLEDDLTGHRRRPPQPRAGAVSLGDSSSDIGDDLGPSVGEGQLLGGDGSGLGSDELEVLAKCEDVILVDSGSLPSMYENSSPGQISWGRVLILRTAPRFGFVVNVEGDCERLRLRIIRDDDATGVSSRSSFCGKSVVTAIDVTVSKTTACTEDEASIEVWLEWRFSVSRARASDGELTPVMTGTIEIGALLPAQSIGDYDQLDLLAVYSGSTTLPKQVGAPGEDPTDVGGARLLEESTNGSFIGTVQGCSGVGALLVSGWIPALRAMWDSALAARVDSRTDLAGPSSICGVRPALYLFRDTPALADCSAWLEGVCDDAPSPCSGPDLDDPDDPDDDTATFQGGP